MRGQTFDVILADTCLRIQATLRSTYSAVDMQSDMPRTRVDMQSYKAQEIAQERRREFGILWATLGFSASDSKWQKMPQMKAQADPRIGCQC